MILSTEPLTKHFVYFSTLLLSKQHSNTTTTTPTRSAESKLVQQPTTTTIAAAYLKSSTTDYHNADEELTTTTTTTTRATANQKKQQQQQQQKRDQFTLSTALRSELKQKTGKPPRWLYDHEMPENYRQPGILSGYVPIGSSYTVCLHSLFTITSNESANFWSHFFAIIYFLASAYQLSYDWTQPFTWPLLAYFFTVCSYMGASCLAHALGSVSPLHMDGLFFIDYAGVSMFSFGAGLVCRAYAFPTSLTDTAYGNGVFLFGSLLMVAFGTIASCSSRLKAASSSHRPNDALLRCAAYLLPYLWNNGPLLVRIISGPITPSVWCHIQQIALSLAAGISYGSGWPERVAPGIFDTLGHSHNLLHLFGTWATQRQMCAMLIDVETGGSGSESHVTRLAYWAVYGTAAAVLINVAIVLVAVARSRQLHNTAENSRVINTKLYNSSCACGSYQDLNTASAISTVANTNGNDVRVRRESQRIKQRNMEKHTK